LQHNTERSFTWQTEVLRSYRDVQTLVGSALVSESIASLGGYTYLETQWRRRWKYGLRYDLTGAPDSADARLWAVAGVVRFIPSEFQEIRFEVRHTRLNAEAAALLDADQDDTRVFFEWIPVIGAHGAHKY
jgi:DNA helicase HerA-like ATPase